MRRGKEIAQGSHASIAFLTRRLNQCGLMFAPLTGAQKEWLSSSFTKVCLQVNSEQELFDIQRNAIKEGLECHLIFDNGATEFSGVSTLTCLAIGPDYSHKIDKVTSHLKLY